MRKLLLACILVSILLSATAQKRKARKILKKMGDNPAYFLDSVRVTPDDIQNINPDTIGFLSVYNQESATKMLGDDGKDGAIYMETITFCKKRYWNYLRAKSQDYAAIAPAVESDSTIQYIINNKLVIKNPPGELAQISNDRLFKNVYLIDKETLMCDYKVDNKQYGVVIIVDDPKKSSGNKSN